MHLLIDGQLRALTPLKTFQTAHQLPASFSVAHFEPKEYDGLGSIERAGEALQSLRAEVVNAVPTGLNGQSWLPYLPIIQDYFRHRLEVINAEVGLRPTEIDFAVAGFGDVCRAVAYAMIEAESLGVATPPFSRIYADWLNESVRVSATAHPYPHEGRTWAVHLITDAYGRVGLRVHHDDQITYVADSALACPAQGFMAGLLEEVATRMMG